MTRKRNRPLRVALWAALGVVVALAGTSAAYAMYFTGHGLPRATIVNASVSGQTTAQVTQALADRVAGVRVSLTLDGVTTDFALADLGTTVDVQATVAAAFQANANVGARFSALAHAQEVPVVVKLDQARVRQVVDGLVAKVGVPARDAGVSISGDGTSFVVNPAQAGKSVDATPLVDAAKQAAGTLTSQTLALTPTEVQPRVSTEQATRLADAAGALVAAKVAVDARGSVHVASAAEKTGWVVLPALGSADPKPVVDEAKVGAWVASVVDASNVQPVPGQRTVNSRGDVVSTPKPGTTGYKANNAAAVTTAVVSALRSGVPYSGALAYDPIEPTYDTRVIADGAEKLVYQAAPGEKWIDVNLSTSSVTAYVGGQVASGPMPVVPGAPGDATQTPTGTFRIYLKYDLQTMRGTNPDGTPYVAPNIPWVSYFTGSIAFHAAPWRSSFGWNGPGGSHGCVNMPTDSAKFIYDWAPMGTVVVSHY